MFGYVYINKCSLSKENTEKYRSFYCGLCHILGEKYGLLSRLTLTYDMTFLALFLSGFFGEQTEFTDRRCFVHPFRKHNSAHCNALEYAAAMNVALAYYNCLDDWNDDKSVIKGAEAILIRRHYKRVKKQYPRQCNVIEKCIKDLSDIEKRSELNPDIPSNCFGRLLGELFVYKEDENKDSLYKFGFDLGKFIYIMDARCDLKTDLRKEKYNPLVGIDSSTAEEILEMLSDAFTDDFKLLGDISEDELLKNILYSGIWLKYAKMFLIDNGKDGDDKNAE